MLFGQTGHFTCSKKRTFLLANDTAEYAVRTKPQAPRSLHYWLTSSSWTGIGCLSQEVNHCDSPSQNHARRARASQLHSGNDSTLSELCRGVRKALRQVA